MSRTASGHNRPTHIALPTSPFVAQSPNGSPLPTPTGGMASPASPRNSFLPSFMNMRTRNRAATLSNPRGATSPSAELSNPMGAPTTRGESSRDLSAGLASRGGGVTRTVSTPVSGGLVSGAGLDTSPSMSSIPTTAPLAQPHMNGGMPPKTYRIRLVPHLETSRSLAFDPVVREILPIVVPTGASPSVAAASVTAVGPNVNGRLPALILKIGRFTEKVSQPGVPATPGVTGNGGGPLGTASGSGNGAGPASVPAPGPIGTGPITIAGGGGDVTSGKVGFKSKVVSRAHAEIWCQAGGKFFIRDTASSSGTFLNHIRLSSPNTESRPAMINDGDVLQLGVDYQGGHEDMFRCIKMRVELGREWQRGANEFNTNALKQLKALGGDTPEGKGKSSELPGPASAKKGKASVTDCCICLFSVTVCQSLFIAPCSHVFHYKCIRPLLMQHHPGFSCPLCRTFANLEEDVETEDAWEIASRRASIISRRPSNHSIRFPYLNEAPADVQSSTNIGFGLASASVDELLGGESGTASEEGGMLGSAPLARQVTAVQETGFTDGGDVDMPEAVREEEEYGDGISPGLGLGDDPDCFSSLAVLTDPSMLDRQYSNPSSGPSSGIPIASASESTHASGFGSLETQTPMNYTFLSTMANGGPDRHVNFAPHANGTGSRRHGTLVEEEEGNGAGGRQGAMIIEAQSGRELRGSRGDTDMMFA